MYTAYMAMVMVRRKEHSTSVTTSCCVPPGCMVEGSWYPTATG